MKLKEFLFEESSSSVNFPKLIKLFPSSVSPKKGGRTGTMSHIRISLRKEPDIKKWLNDLDIPVKFEDESSTIASGMFATWKGTASSDIKDEETGKLVVPKAGIFYVVNTIKEDSKINRKEFEPAKFGLNTDKKWKDSEVIHEIEKELKGSKFKHYSEDEQDYFKELLTKCKTGKPSYHIKAPDSLSKEDLKILGINFGEILSAIWAVNKTDGDGIIFPTNDQPLLDFSITDGHQVRDFSAKSAGDGGPPSMDVIAKFIEDNKSEFSDFDSHKLKVIETIHKEKILQGILKSSELLKTPGYKILQKITKVNPQDVKALEHWLRSIPTLHELESTLEPLYKATKSRPMKNSRTDTIKDLFENKKVPIIGLVISPLAYHLVEDVLNKDDEFTDILNRAAKLLTVSQVYTNISPTEITFVIKDFEKSKFKWRNNATAKNANNKKISFVISH